MGERVVGMQRPKRGNGGIGRRALIKWEVVGVERALLFHVLHMARAGSNPVFPHIDLQTGDS